MTRSAAARCAASALGVLATVGCELAEVTIPSTEPIVVVQAIMRPDLPQQWVVVERSLTGADVRQSTPGEIPIDKPQLPVVGASVEVENVSFPDDPCGNPVAFTRDPGTGSVIPQDGLYWAPGGCPSMRTGDTLRLRVETQDGVVVTGETTVAGAQSMFLRLGADSIDLPGPQLPFNRDTDTITAGVDAVAGRALQIDVRQRLIRRWTRRVTSLFVDTTSVTLPGDLMDLFGAGTGNDVFRGGRRYLLGVAFGDGNYFDYVRSRNGALSGRGFINHLDGGLGVFASVVADTASVRVVAERDDPREGVYRLQGKVGIITVDVQWELYLARSIPDSTDFSAFITGDWRWGPIDESLNGYMVGDTISAMVEQVIGDPEPWGVDRHTVEGVLSQQSPSQLVVRDVLGRIVGTLTATR